MADAIKSYDKKVVISNSYNICVLCKANFSENELHRTSQFCHIISKKENGPRGYGTEEGKNFIKEKFKMTVEEFITEQEKKIKGRTSKIKKINTSYNLILLCENCHSKIDNENNVQDGKEYSIEELFLLKEKHEDYHAEKLKESVIKIDYNSFDSFFSNLTESLESEEQKDEKDFNIISTEEKINKNNISKMDGEKIKIGISKARSLNNFFSKNERYSPDNYCKVKRDVIKIYKKFVNRDSSDLIFNNMFSYYVNGYVEYCKDNKTGYNINDVQANVIVFLSYFFERCEIFKK